MVTQESEEFVGYFISAYSINQQIDQEQRSVDAYQQALVDPEQAEALDLVHRPFGQVAQRSTLHNIHIEKLDAELKNIREEMLARFLGRHARVYSMLPPNRASPIEGMFHRPLQIAGKIDEIPTYSRGRDWDFRLKTRLARTPVFITAIAPSTELQPIPIIAVEFLK